MIIDMLKKYEPLFDSWYIDNTVARGRGSVIFRAVRTNEEGLQEYIGIKTVRFPKTEREFNDAVLSGKYESADEYLDSLQKTVEENMRTMIRLRTNPNIIRFDNYKIIRESNCFHLVILMELLTALGDFLSSERMNGMEIAKMGTDLCLALDGFRSVGIMHREIKPENIFVDGEGNYKLGDFGVSMTGSSKTSVQESSTYLAPELYSPNARDISSDIYSVGILMYKFMNNNRMPFLPNFPAPISISDRETAFSRRMSGELLPKPANADTELSKIIFKAAAYRTVDRYYEPSALKAALENYIEFPNGNPAGREAPVRPYRAPHEGDVYFKNYNAKKERPMPSIIVEEQEIENEEENDTKSNKKMYALIAVLLIFLFSIIGYVIKLAFFNDSPTEPSTTTSETPYSTENTTVEETTLSTTESTTETTSETTTQTTTETTSETTTESTSATTEPTTQQQSSGYQFLQATKNPGDKTADGKEYKKLDQVTALKQVSDDNCISKVIVNINDSLGANAHKTGNAYIIQTYGSTITLKETVDFECLFDSSDEESVLACVVSIDREIYFEEGSDYYICFEEGAISGDAAVNLPIEVKL